MSESYLQRYVRQRKAAKEAKQEDSAERAAKVLDALMQRYIKSEGQRQHWEDIKDGMRQKFDSRAGEQ